MTATIEIPRWRTLLDQAKAAGETNQDIADRLDVSRTMVSLALWEKYPSSLDAFIKRVLDAYDLFPCPHLGERITGKACKEYALRPAPTSSARDARHWLACQTCPHKPAQEARK
ncbi:MAG: LacI family transcriptional regulator [Proteobacteria bacterium]|nr:LacI family transcriptional regulator [Pseudomonadota bacterium]